MQIRNMKTQRRILLILGGALIGDTIAAAFLCNYNLGVILPGCLGLPLLLLGLFFPHTLSGIGRTIRKILLRCYALGCAFLLFLGGCMVYGVEQGRGQEADGLIVLGAALHGEKVTWVLSNRLDAAYDYLVEHPDCLCVVSGGQGSGESRTEASAMKEYLVNRGIGAERILTEEQAASTKENFLFSKDILDGVLGENARLAFVTTDFHVFRAGRTAARLGIEVFGVAAEDVWYIRLNNFLRECVGICYYFVRGWI